MICHDHKCIFVHIPKNAGQSIERIFVDLVGLDWRTRAPLLLRTNREPELGPPKLAHLQANQYVSCKYLTQEMFDEYFKFAFTRNPWSRMVSIYKHLGFTGKCDFRTFLKSEFRNKIFNERNWFVGPQSGFVCADNGNLIVDYIGKVEDLQNEFNHVCSEIGIRPIQVPHTNSAEQKEDTAKQNGAVSSVKLVASKLAPDLLINKPNQYSTYQEYYDQESIEIVAELYRRDIELFSYDFE